jgi:hypothetical protein
MVAAPEDLVRARVASALEPRRRPSKAGKDRLDLARLIGAFPDLWSLVPEALQADIARLRDTGHEADD